MSEHRVLLTWQKETESFRYADYNREHAWSFPKSQVVVRASAAPKYLGKPDAVDPEEAFVAAVSSCHLLTLLAICARRGVVIESYRDDAVGYLEANPQRRLAITRIVLKPSIRFAAGHWPDAATLAAIHHEAHEACFIANSVTTSISIDESAQEVAS